MNFQAVDSRTDQVSAAFAALADPTRRAILSRLAQGETSVGDLIKPFAISGPAISRHLRVLENAKLIERKVDAQWRICRLNAPGLRVASDWLSQYREFWDHSLDRLVEVLEQDDGHMPAAQGHPAPPPAVPQSRQGPQSGSSRRSSTPKKRTSP
jgi:DNA-binding transcriptional ArsR family regulator